MIQRARLLSVITLVACGAVAVISSTQTWLSVVLDDGAGHTLDVAGASAVPVLAPLGLAVLALGGALSIVGLVLRYVFGALTVLIAAALGWMSAQVVFGTPTSAVASTVTESTGITGIDAVAELVSSITQTSWPTITFAVSVVLFLAGLFIVATARGWRGSGRRYRADTATPVGGAGSRPHDAIDSWDDLSRGEDPTDRPLD